MIRVNDIVLTVADQVVEPRWPIDLGELLFLPQTQLPGAHLYEPPARPPFKYEFAPGTLYWPQGASRFALGQYVVTAAEALALRLKIGVGFINGQVTLSLTTPHTADEVLEFQMHVLHLLPLQYHYAQSVAGAYPPDVEDAVYLLLLVDFRYYFQLPAPPLAPALWVVDEGTTTWDDLDGDIADNFDHAHHHAGEITFDAVHADYSSTSKPSRYLGALSLASEGVVSNYGHLLDSIGLATGRRFVANRDGTFMLQNATTARAAHEADATSWLPERRYGGDLSFRAEVHQPGGGYRDTQAFHAFVVPFNVQLIFPTLDISGDETDRTKLLANFSTLHIAGDLDWPETDSPIYEGDLYVATTYWIESGDTTDAQTLTERFAIDWYDWLAQPEITCYSGVVPFEPNGFTDSIVWVTRKNDVYTLVQRGMLNPRPGVLLWYSGVDAPAGPEGTVTSVGLSLPAIFSVSGSPVTTSGTLTGSLVVQAANRVWAGPTSGGSATPTFRALVSADMPAGLGTVTSVAMTAPGTVFSVGGSPVTTSGTLALTFTVQSARTFFAGPTSGASAVPFFRSIFSDDLPDDGVTFAKIQNLTANRLLGRQPASAGDVQEITPGSGLTLTGTTLDVTMALTDLTDFSTQTLDAYSPTDLSTPYSPTDPADTPVTADALRDDLVAGFIPDLYTQLNELRTALAAAQDAIDDLRAKSQAAGILS